MNTEWKLTLVLDSTTRDKLYQLSKEHDASCSWTLRKMINDQFALLQDKKNFSQVKVPFET